MSDAIDRDAAMACARGLGTLADIAALPAVQPAPAPDAVARVVAAHKWAKEVQSRWENRTHSDPLGPNGAVTLSEECERATDELQEALNALARFDAPAPQRCAECTCENGDWDCKWFAPAPQDKVREAGRQRKQQPPPVYWNGNPAPFSAEQLEKRIDDICGCAGRHDCDCISVFNKSTSALWSEHNSALRQIAEGGEG